VQYQTADEAVEAWAKRLSGAFVKSWMWPGGMMTARFRMADWSKTFRPFHLTVDDGAWADGDPEGPLPLYRRGDVKRFPDEPVFLAEGEVKADTLATLGFLGIASAHGANGASETDWTPLAGRFVVILPDNDDPGRKYARQVADMLLVLSPPAKVKIVALPGLPLKGDIIDWVAPTGFMGAKTVPEIVEALEKLALEAPFYPVETAVPATPKGPVDVGVAQGDVRLGLEFVGRYGDRVRYCSDLDEWYLWDGRRWAPDMVHKAELLVKEMALEQLMASTKIADSNRRDSEVKFWLRAMKMTGVAGCLQAARSETSIIAYLADLDKAPWLLTVLNGTIDLQTGHLGPHNPKHLITRLAPVAYCPAADRAEWMRFLERVIPDPEVRDFLQRAAAYSLTGQPVEEVLFFVHGPTNGGGKSTFVSALKSALGDYAATANFESFLAQHNKGGPREDIVRLGGRRFVSSVETEEGDKLAGGLLKWLTGQDMITQRSLYREHSVEFLPTFTPWLVSNFKPRAKDDDPALWRRLRLVPFETPIPEDDRDPDVKIRLSDPAIGGPPVLAWAVDGCRLWQENGLRPPSAVLLATRQWRAENNPISDWLADRTISDPQARTLFKDLYANYKVSAVENGIKFPVAARKFEMSLGAANFESDPKRADRTYIGIRLKGDQLSLDGIPTENQEPY